MKQKYGEGLIGRKVRIFTNGDISVLDTPWGDIRQNFGPTYGSQGVVYGKIVDVDIKYLSWINEFEVVLYIEYDDNGKLGLHTSGWDMSLEKYNNYIAYVKETVETDWEENK